MAVSVSTTNLAAAAGAAGGGDGLEGEAGV